MRSTPIAAAFVFASSLLPAQSNAIAGLDMRVYDVVGTTVYGRRGAAYPGGEVGIGLGHSFCNSGTVPITWVSQSGGLMIDTYPKIAFLLACERDGRMVQISGKSYMKHSRTPFNFSSGPCAPCQSGPSGTMRIGCSDTYSTGFNGNQYNLGPTDEVDPWLGTWQSMGSYFDRGDPAVTGSAAMDRVQSLSSTQVSAFGPVKNRIEVLESDLTGGGTFYGQVHAMIVGEPVENRANNLMSRRATYTWNGTTWSASLPGAVVQGSVLTQWTGATTALGGNGADDGRFLVACKVTGPVDGLWHYEYAVHNIDNARGGASLRLPICPDARVLNAGFHDIDRDATNEWTVSRTPSELSFLAAASNALDWNTIYNFWFDSDAAPVAGTASIDEARPGAGAMNVAVAATVPGVLGHQFLGAGCGSPAPILAGNSVPSVPNPTHALVARTAPGAAVVFGLALGGASVALPNGCVSFLDNQLAVASVGRTADASGLSTWSIPIPPGLTPFDVYVQAVEFVAGGPLFGQLALSNGLRMRVGATGCP
jgi:hypothetical protein